MGTQTYSVSFTKCKPSKGEWCSATSSYSDGTATETNAFEWQISDKGDTYTERESDSTDVENYQVWTIDELTKKSFIISRTEDDDVYKITFAAE